MKVGDCIKMPTPGNKIPHPWFVVADKPDGSCVIVNMTTLGHVCDKTVILHKDEHPTVLHDSIILYSDAQITTLETLDLLVSRGAASKQDACSPDFLKKIQEGIAKSPETRIYVLNFCGINVPKTANPPARPPRR
jgi:hypothetical protein